MAIDIVIYCTCIYLQFSILIKNVYKKLCPLLHVNKSPLTERQIIKRSPYAVSRPLASYDLPHPQEEFFRQCFSYSILSCKYFAACKLSGDGAVTQLQPVTFVTPTKSIIQ